MMRRSRISVRPNVKPTGRAPVAAQDNVQPPQGPADSAPSERSEVMPEKLKTDPPIALGRSNEEASQSRSSNNQLEAISHGADVASKSSDAQDSASTSVTSGPQRRKRFTALPNLAKPRASPASSRTPKSPSKSPVKPVTLSETETSTPTAETSLQIPEPGHNSSAPGIWRPPGRSRQAKAQPIPEAPLRNDQETVTQEDGGLEDTVIPLTVQQGESQRPLRASKPDTILVHENPPECPVPPAVEDMVTQQESVSEPSLGQSQTDVLKERLKELRPLKILKSLTTLNDPADMVRLAQARKLRELLKKEMNKNKEEKKKPKLGIKERKAPKDHTKMTMRELIYYLPVSNPMKSFTDEEQKASETELDDSPTPTSSKTPAVPSVQETVEEDAGNEEEEERVDDTQPEEEEPMVVPRVKVAEDGSLIIDEESLTVQVSRAKGPNPAEDRDPIFERGSTTTYSSFRKGTYTKPWSSGETELFFLAISMVGTDFSMIGQLFPHRCRLEIKNKFKKEERNNSWRIDKSFKEKRRLDLDFFQKLMEQVLKAEENKKNKNKELSKLAKAQSRVHRTVKAKRKRKEIDTSEDSDSDVVAGEKENEDLSNDGGSDTTSKKHRGKGANTPQRRIKRTNGEAIDEPEDCENATSDGQSQDDRLREADSSENINKSPAIKPAQLKGRSQRPIQNFSRRWGNRRPEPKSNTREGGTSVNQVPSELIQEGKNEQSKVFLESEDLEEEPDLSSVHEQIFNKPTRSGRIPKLSLHVMQAAAEEEEDEEELSEPPVSSKTCNQGIKAPGRRAKLKPGPTLKQGMHRRGKSRLVTLRASGAEDDDEEDEDVEDCVLSQVDFPSYPEEENQAFVPMSLRPLLPVNSEVVETMEELDISVNVPDILGTSQNALCPEISYEQAALPAGPVTYEHQLDLLADVIEFLDPDHMEECKEINNEAAQTLLTIGNSAQMTQTSEIPCTGENDILGQSSIVHEEVVHEEVITETAGPSVSCESELKDDVEFSSCKTHIPELSAEETKEEPVKSQSTDAHLDPIQHETPDLACSNSVPPPKIGRFSKPKPNIGKGLRTRRAPQQKIYPELVTGSVERSKGPSVTEKDTNATQPMQENSVPVVPNYPEVLQLEKSSEIREDGLNVVPERVTEEDNGSLSSLKRKNDDKITEEKIKAQEEAGESQLTNSVSESQSTSDEPAKPVRRSRGPKPKPNLTQTSRHTRTQTQHKTVINEKLPAAESSTSTFTKSPDEGAVVSTESDVSQSAAQEVASSTESAQAVKDVTPTVVSEDESRKKTVVMLDENKKTSPVKVFEDSTVKRFGCESEEISAEPTPEEPLFILSLTEIPPTLDEGVGFRTEPLPLTAASELHSHGQSANESREVSHLLITDALVPVSEDEEKKSGEGDVDKWRKGGLKRKTPASVSQGSTEGESQAEHHVVELLGSPVAEGTKDEKEHLEKKRKLPERTRRAKLQVKPIPISRRNARGVDAKEETAALSLKETTPLSISTRETRSVPEQTVPADVSTTDNSTSATISDREANTDLTATSDSSRSPQRENDPQESFQKGPSQGIMGQVELPGKETVELASGPNSQSVSQITPIATSGSLTRPGRKPKGFLSFISPKSTQGPSTAHRGAKPVPQKPTVNTTRPERKRIAAGPVTMAKNPNVKGPSPTAASTTASVIEQNSEEEPTSVSKYFFSDIFTEVDELEDLD
ncbi:transcription factor TFIIIB component B'' homolog isoform X3 [Pimephales promelas]|uniref:transcription factor TFIIIB component B'' homolog isoform X3 n=1 Tax=Pimephales promelas TaxID=90988 RepID=UPI001955B82E|nr:transcription factor TFIIIB component B'' homolog isoform X3 [Pimephales promelas]